MARSREPRATYSPSYRRRVEARLGGLTIEQAHARGISLAAARGHHRAPGAPAEKAQLEQRRRARGDLTDRDRRFADKQARRLNRDPSDVRDDLRAMSPADRDLLITVQGRAERSYNRSKYTESDEARTGSATSKKGRKSKKYKKSYRWDLDPGQQLPFPASSPFRKLYYYH